MFWYNNDIETLLHKCDTYTGSQPIVFFGSSSIRLWEHMTDNLSPWPVMNLGFGGSTISACCWFFEKVISPLDPRALVLYAGENDLGDRRHPEEVINQFRLFVSDWHTNFPRRPIFFISVKHSPSRAYLNDQINFVNQQIKALCEDKVECTYIDITESMRKDGHHVNPDHFHEDALHMNQNGYDAWTPHILSALENKLGNSF